MGRENSRQILSCRQHFRPPACEVTTVALRRVDTDTAADNILDYVPEGCAVMVNTSGARTADEAVRIARLARAAGAGDWIKIEVIADQKYLLPDNIETLRAAEILVKEGFVVFPYMSPGSFNGPGDWPIAVLPPLCRLAHRLERTGAFARKNSYRS